MEKERFPAITRRGTPLDHLTFPRWNSRLLKPVEDIFFFVFTCNAVCN
jgi:hypothetical protein